jgi:hypothetical protein
VVQGASASDRTALALIEQVALKAGLTSAEISLADLGNDAECGIACMNEVNAREALDSLCATIGAWWTFDRTGILRVYRLTDPAYGAACQTLTEAEIKNNISRDPTADSDRGVPVYRVTCRYAQNYTVQNSDLAGAVTDSRRAELAREFRSAVAADASVQTQHLLAAEMDYPTCFAFEADAQAEAVRQLALRSVRRDRLTVTVLDDVFVNIRLGDVVSVVLPRFGMDLGKHFLVIGYQPDYRLNRGDLTLWG